MLQDDQLQFNSDGEDDDLEHDPSINHNRVWTFVGLIYAVSGGSHLVFL